MKECELVESPPKFSHGITQKFIGEDGIIREINILKDLEHYYIEIITFWEGEDKEPSVLSFRISSEAYERMLYQMLELGLLPDKYIIPE